MIPQVVFIVPYRKREHDRTHFSIYMRYLMEDIQYPYEIYYSHLPDDGRPFNRGCSKNMGFLAVKNKYPDDYKSIIFVFNDVDTHPKQKNMIDYVTEEGVVKHFYGFTFALGGIFSITGKNFEECSGFPNFWGYGFEDNIIQKRVLANKITINRDVFFKIYDNRISQTSIITNNLMSKQAIITATDKTATIDDDLNTITNFQYNIQDYVENTSLGTLNEFIINIDSFSTKYAHTEESFFITSQTRNFHKDMFSKQKQLGNIWSK